MFRQLSPRSIFLINALLALGAGFPVGNSGVGGMSFDRIAPHDDWMEAVSSGGLLQRVRTTWLADLEGCPRILSAGEGHGRFASACARRFPDARLMCLEESPLMLARGRWRVARTGPPRGSVDRVCASLPAWGPPEGSFDAIATCFFLDCFDGRVLAEVIERLAGAATGHDVQWRSAPSRPASG